MVATYSGGGTWSLHVMTILYRKILTTSSRMRHWSLPFGRGAGSCPLCHELLCFFKHLNLFLSLLPPPPPSPSPVPSPTTLPSPSLSRSVSPACYVSACLRLPPSFSASPSLPSFSVPTSYLFRPLSLPSFISPSLSLSLFLWPLSL